MTAAVEVGPHPTVCGCRCGCDYRLQSEASVAQGLCFSCRVGLHAGRRPGWHASDPEPTEPDGPGVG